MAKDRRVLPKGSYQWDGKEHHRGRAGWDWGPQRDADSASDAGCAAPGTCPLGEGGLRAPT